MMRIICDTMIWYNFSQGKLQIPDPKKYKIVCTYLSLMELAFTLNNFNKLSEVQDAIKIIFKIKPEIILTYPYDHARELIDEEYINNRAIKDDLVFAFLGVLL